MNKSIYWVGLVSLFFLIFSCKVKQTNSPPDKGIDKTKVKAFEPEKLINDISNMVFEWDNPNNPDQNGNHDLFRLYKLVSATGDRNHKTHKFELIFEKEIEEGNSYSFEDEDNNPISNDSTYAWEAIGYDENGSKIKREGFIPFNKSKVLTSNINFFTNPLFNPKCIKWKRQPYNCETVICTASINPCPPQNTHIATLVKFDNLRKDNFRLSPDFDPKKIDTTCIKYNGNIKVKGSFAINIPCDSLSIVNETEIKGFLFLRDSLYTKDEIFEWDFSINEGDNDTSLILDTLDYIKSCEGVIGDSLVCQASVNFHLEFFAFPGDTLFNFVFYLPENQSHQHDLDSISTTLSSECLEFSDPTKFSYYKCRDNIDDHISQHIVITPIKICPE